MWSGIDWQLISDVSAISKENGSDRRKTKETGEKKGHQGTLPLDEMPNHKGEDTSNKTEITLSW